MVAAGGRVEQQADGLVQALVAPGSLRQLAASGAVASVAPPAVPVAQAVDEGVQATGADVWQTAGYDGTGVKVAIIDLGFYGYQALLGTALPASVTTDDRCSGNLTAAPRDGGTEHGTAVAEVVHQMAPGAQLYSDVRRQRGRSRARRAGCDRGRREGDQPLGRAGSTRAAATAPATRGDARRDRRRRPRARDPLGERRRELRGGSLERHVHAGFRQTRTSTTSRPASPRTRSRWWRASRRACS